MNGMTKKKKDAWAATNAPGRLTTERKKKKREKPEGITGSETARIALLPT